jgi:hypothetical protein
LNEPKEPRKQASVDHDYVRELYPLNLLREKVRQHAEEGKEREAELDEVRRELEEIQREIEEALGTATQADMHSPPVRTRTVTVTGPPVFPEYVPPPPPGASGGGLAKAEPAVAFTGIAGLVQFAVLLLGLDLTDEELSLLHVAAAGVVSALTPLVGYLVRRRVSPVQRFRR